MLRNAEITLKTLYTNKVIALRKFELNEENCTDEQYYEMSDNIVDCARWFEQAVAREVAAGNTHPMEVIRHIAKWDVFIATRINKKENADLFKL